MMPDPKNPKIQGLCLDRKRQENSVFLAFYLDWIIPQTNGQTECINQEVKQYLWLFVNFHQDDWVEWLLLAEFSYNYKI